MLLGKNKHAILIAVFLLFAASSSGQAGKSFKYRLNDGNIETIDAISGNQSLTINYSVSELEVEDISTEHGIFYKVSIPGHIFTTSPGKPQLPVLSRLITIPEGSEYSISITEIKSKVIKPSGKNINGILFPAQEGEVKDQIQKKPDFRFDKAVYSSKKIIPLDTVKIEPLGSLRNKRLANLYVSPVRYNPQSNSLEVITSMKIVVNFTNAGTITKSLFSESALFNESLEKGVMNYTAENVINGYSDQPVKMIIITDTAFRKHLQPYIQWKTQKGFNIRVLFKGSSFAGNNYSELKDTLTAIYNSSTESDPPPEYLLIVGNTNRIPSYGTGNITDMYYGEFDGNGDYIPEMYIGRLPVADTTELKAFVKKIIQYEKFQFAGTNTFHTNAIAVAGYDAAYANHMNGQVNYAISNYLINSNNINESHFYYYPRQSQELDASLKATKDSILSKINNGTSFINYTGHGDATGWLHLNIKVSDTALFTNKNMYPFIISNACRTAQYSIANSFGNRMVVSENKGAIGFIGCSNDSYWDEDFFWAVGTGIPSSNPIYVTTGLGAYDRFFHTHNEHASEWYYTMGQINYAGNLSVSASTTSRKKYYWETYNLIGDPSVIPILGKPQQFNIALPDTLPNGMRSWSFNAKPFSYVAVSHFDTLWDATFSSASGAVKLELPDIENDSCLIVITGQNNIPLIKTIYFSDVNTEFVNLASTEINDSVENNNGLADYGESVFLKIKISNLGMKDATNLNATISSASDWITIKTNTSNIGTLRAGSAITLTDDLEFSISSDVPDMGIATIILLLKDNVTEKSYNIDIPIHAPDLKIINFSLDDRVTGNGDFIADPGETYKLVFKVINEGSSDISGQFFVSSQNSELTIVDKDVKSGVIKFGESTDIPVTVKLSENTSSGSYISVNSLLDCTPFILNKDFTFRVGKIRESFESELFTTFPWINRSPKPWIINNSETIDGNISARSGDITHNGTSSLVIRARYDGDDSLKFFNKVSSEKNYDYLVFKLNDIEVFRKSGEIPWEKIVVPVKAGYNKMEWVFSMDATTLGGYNCAWIDLIDFANTSSVRYIEKDLEVAKIIKPVERDRYGMVKISVKVLNTGRDTLKGFYLAYIIDNQTIHARQSFNNVLVPFGDTVTVTFNSKADMSKLGIYDILVYGYNNHDDYSPNDSLSGTVENTEILESLVIFPNPFSDKLTIFINAPGAEKLTISITGSSGAQMYRTESTVVTGKNTIVLEDIRLSPAAYHLNIRGSTINKTIPILKMK